MVVDAVRSYFDAVSGLTELTRKRAVTAAKTLLKVGDDRTVSTASPPDRASPAGEDEGDPRTSRVGHDIQSLAAELIETNQANRAALASMVEAEVNRVLERHDLVRRDEYERVVRRVAELERRLATQRGPGSRTAAGGSVAAAPQGESSMPTGEPADEATTEPETATDTADEQTATETEPTVGSGGSGQATRDQSDPQEPATKRRSATAGKNTATTGKQPESKTAGKSGKSKSTTKRSGGRARSTTPANSNEQ